jgi:hypothetical protein
MNDIVDRLNDHCVGHPYAKIEWPHRLLHDARDEIERLRTENWQLRQACGYPIPADKETPQNPFKCGICDARAQSPADREGK